MKYLSVAIFLFMFKLVFAQYEQGTKFSFSQLPTLTPINGKFKQQKAYAKKFNLWVLADLKSIEGDVVFQDIKTLQDSFPTLQVVLFDVGSPHNYQTELVKNWCHLNQPNFPVVFDLDSTLFKSLGIVESPNLFVFNPNGLSLGTLHTEEMHTMLFPYLKQYLDSTSLNLTSKKLFKPKNEFHSLLPHFRDIIFIDDTLLAITNQSQKALHIKKSTSGKTQVLQADFEPYALCNSDRGLLVSSIKTHNVYQQTKGFTKILGDDKRENFRVLEKNAYSALNYPTDVFYAKNSIYVSTAAAHQIWDFTANDLLGNTYAGNAHYSPFFEDGYRYDAGIRYPMDFTTDGTDYYFIDGGLNLVRKISKGYLSTPSYNFDLKLKYPTSIDSDGKNLFIVDMLAKQIKVVNLMDKSTYILIDLNDTLTSHEFPIALTYKKNKLYIIINRNPKTLEFDLASKAMRFF